MNKFTQVYTDPIGLENMQIQVIMITIFDCIVCSWIKSFKILNRIIAVHTRLQSNHVIF